MPDGRRPLADSLNPLLPERYFAEPQTHAGTRVEIDVATFENPPAAISASPRDGNIAVLPAQVWAPLAPAQSVPGVRPKGFEVLIFNDDGGARLVGAVELASPGYKDRQDERRAFAVKCANYLYQGIGLVIIDIVTSRPGILHNDII